MKSIHRILNIFLLTIIAFSVNAQKEVLSEEINESMWHSKIGPNQRFYFATYFGLNSPISIGELNIDESQSLGIDLGFRSKLKVCNFLSFVGDINYKYSKYTFVDKEGFLLDDDLWKDEVIGIRSLGGNAHMRLNFGRRGNHLGKYIDGGVWWQYNIYNSHQYFKKEGVSRIKLKIKNREDFIAKTSWGYSAGIGWNKIRIYGKIWMTDLLIHEDARGALPKYSVGVQLDI